MSSLRTGVGQTERVACREAAGLRRNAATHWITTRRKGFTAITMLALRWATWLFALRSTASLNRVLQFLGWRIGNHYDHLRELAIFGFHGN